MKSSVTAVTQFSFINECGRRRYRTLGRGLLVQLSELLHHAGHVGHPLPHLGGGTTSGEVCQGPGARLSLGVDVGHLPLLLPAHYELGVVLEVVDLEEEVVTGL